MYFVFGSVDTDCVRVYNKCWKEQVAASGVAYRDCGVADASGGGGGGGAAGAPSPSKRREKYSGPHVSDRKKNEDFCLLLDSWRKLFLFWGTHLKAFEGM